MDSLDRLRTALAGHGESLAPADPAAVAAAEERIGRPLPEPLRRLYLEVANGTAGLKGGQPLLAVEELGPPTALDPDRPELDVDGGGRVRGADLVALTEEDVDGGTWCLLPDGRVAYHLPLNEPPALHLALVDSAQLVEVLAACGADELVGPLDGIYLLRLSPREDPSTA